MHVAVLGGGLQGCCIALALADRGLHVTLFDRNASLLSRAAVANEGKIHLGYMYASDPSLATARMMIRGALAFAPFLARHLGRGWTTLSQPAAYLAHRDSQRSSAEISHYFKTTYDLILAAAEGRRDAYFGIDVAAEPREWSASETEAEFNPEIVLTAFDSPEVAIDPVALASAVRVRIGDDPRIDVRLEQTVRSVEEEREGLFVVSHGSDGVERARYDHVVNALWDGRLAINETMGLRTNRPWLHRLKYGVSFRRPDGMDFRSATIICGPFGEVVNYSHGLTYLTWYPACLRDISRDVTPPDWRTYAEEPLRSEILAGTLAGLSEIMPALGNLRREDLADASVKGGAIVAWGKSDIDDPASELHCRFEIGVTSVGRFHSVDPGKLTMAPYFADVCADQIAPTG